MSTIKIDLDIETDGQKSYAKSLYLSEGKPEFIGRGSEWLTLSVASVSRKHCSFFVEGGSLFLLDEGSSHGTFVNEYRIQTKTVLKVGDQIKVGKVKLKLKKFELSMGAGPVASVKPASGARQLGGVKPTAKNAVASVEMATAPSHTADYVVQPIHSSAHSLGGPVGGGTFGGKWELGQLVKDPGRWLEFFREGIKSPKEFFENLNLNGSMGLAYGVLAISALVQGVLSFFFIPAMMMPLRTSVLMAQVLGGLLFPLAFTGGLVLFKNLIDSEARFSHFLCFGALIVLALFPVIILTPMLPMMGLVWILILGWWIFGFSVRFRVSILKAIVIPAIISIALGIGSLGASMFFGLGSQLRNFKGINIKAMTGKQLRTQHRGTKLEQAVDQVEPEDQE